MAIRFVDVGSRKSEADGAEPAPQAPEPAARAEPEPPEPDAAAEAGPARPGPAAKPRGRRKPAPAPSAAPGPDDTAAPLLDAFLFPEVQAPPRTAPKPRRHRRGFG